MSRKVTVGELVAKLNSLDQGLCIAICDADGWNCDLSLFAGNDVVLRQEAIDPDSNGLFKDA